MIAETDDYADLRVVLRERKIGPSAFVATGKVPVNGLPHDHEGDFEARFLVLLSFDADVASVETQPITFHWKDRAGRSRSYTPDMLVRYHSWKDQPHRGQGQLIEVKPKVFLKKNRKDLEPKFAVAKFWCQREGYVFRIVTEDDISEDVAWNLRFLRRYSDPKIMLAQTTDRVRARTLTTEVSSVTDITVEQLVAAVSTKPQDQAMLFPIIWHLLAANAFRCDLTARLNNRTRLWLGSAEVPT